MDAELTAAHCDNCYCTQVDDWVDVPVQPVVDAADTFARDAVALVHIDLKFVQKFLEMLAFYIHSWDSDETLCMNVKENQFGWTHHRCQFYCFLSQINDVTVS